MRAMLFSVLLFGCEATAVEGPAGRDGEPGERGPEGARAELERYSVDRAEVAGDDGGAVALASCDAGDGVLTGGCRLVELGPVTWTTIGPVWSGARVEAWGCEAMGLEPGATIEAWAWCYSTSSP